MTHDELVQRAARWLRNTKRCGVVLTEFVSAAPEIPDAIGWTTGGQWSYLVECKTGIGDFYSDARKPGRNLKSMGGIGRERYYLAEKGKLDADRVTRCRPGWGLLEICGRQVRVKLKAMPFEPMSTIRETPLLYSYIRRHQIKLESKTRRLARSW